MKAGVLLFLVLAVLTQGCQRLEEKAESGVLYEPNIGDVAPGQGEPAPKLNEFEVSVNKRIQWIVGLPAGYVQMSDEELSALDGRAKEVVGEDAPLTRTLFGVKKGDFKNSVLVSKYSSLSMLTQGASEVVAGAERGMLDVYESQGVPFSTSKSVVSIDDLVFSRQNTTLYGDFGKTKPVLYQTTWNRVFDHELFTITVSATDGLSWALMTKRVEESTFR